ncbi:hypothetical protein F5882DRAFT_269729, partial [Hyaloscypha sp. PMI_1271]
MSVKLLPNTSITSIVMNGRIYVYAQLNNGDLYEFKGHIKPASPQPIYIYDKKNLKIITTRLKDNELAANALKLFTPIAAVPYTRRANETKTERYLFYVNNHNILRD